MNQCVVNTSRIPCRDCAISLEGELEEIDGVEMVKVDYETDIVKIYYNKDDIDIEKVKQIIEEAGYRIKRIIY